MQCLAVKAAHSFKYFTFVMSTIIFLTLHDLAMLFTSAKLTMFSTVSSISLQLRSWK